MAARAAAAPAAVKTPDQWSETFEELWENVLKRKDQIVLSHELNSPLNSNTLKARLMLCVRTLPRLGVIKGVLRELAANPRSMASDGRRYVEDGQVPQFARLSDLQWSTTTIWAVESTFEGRVMVIDALTGVVVMVIADPKRGVLVSSLMHAPFKGLINRQLEVIPIDHPRQLLQVRESSLINTDYMWIGFSDGSIRLFPASAQRVCESDRSAMMAKGELADIVFELPKYHKGAIVAIARSPCHEDDKITEVTVGSRLSAAIHELTAATSQVCCEGREHLSLVCTASEDSCIAVWDLKKIYGCIEELRALCRRRSSGMRDYNSWSASFRGDAVSFLLNPSSGSSQGIVRSTCTMVKVRPLFKLKGGVGGLRTLRWISTVVTTRNYTKPRDVVAMTRDPKESTAPKLIKNRRAFQDMTRWERREEHRRMLGLSEREMRDVERELEVLMPPLAVEPVQSKRVNLIISGDVHGTVHLWDLDEELETCLASGAPDLCPIPVQCLSPTTSAPDGPADSTRFMSYLSIDNRSTSNDHANNSLTPCGNESFCTSPSTRHPLFTPRVVAGVVGTRGSRSDRLNGVGRTGRLSTRIPITTPRLTLREHTHSAGITPQVSSRTASKTPKTSLQKQQRPSACFTPEVSSSRKATFAAVKDSGTCKLRKPAGRGEISVSTTRKPRRKPSSLGGQLGSCTADGLKSSLCETPHVGAARHAAQTTGRRVAKTSGKTTKTKAPWDPFTRSTKERRDPLLSSSMSPAGRASVRTRSARVKKKSSRAAKLSQDQVGGAPTESTDNNVSDFQWTPSAGRRSYLPTYSIGVRYVEQVSTHSYTNSCRSPCRRDERRRTSRAADHRQINDLYARKAKFTKDLIDGGTVTGIVVDLPPVITVTMRLLPDPPEFHFSLLEQPSEEEVRRRVLANTFNELTNNRALYSVFDNLKFYVSVEGVVMNMQCVPKLQKARGGSSSPSQSPRRDPFESVDDVTFNIVFQRRVIEKHSQPVVLLFNDQARRQLWIARNDGLLSVLSTVTDRVITRVPHPSADAALGPPSAADLKRQHVGSLLGSGRAVHLEVHRECRKYPIAHFVNFAPVSVLRQFAILKASRIRSCTNGVGRDRFHGVFYGSYTGTSIAALDARKALDGYARSREAGLSDLLSTLMQCRENIASMRAVQRDLYSSLCSGISHRVGRLVSLYSTIDTLNAAEWAFRDWKLYCQYFPRGYVLRNIKRKSLNHLSRMVTAMLEARTAIARREWLNKWILLTYNRGIQQTRCKLKQVLRIEERGRLEVKVLSFVANFHHLRHYWRLWRGIIPSALEGSVVRSPVVKTPLTTNAGSTALAVSPRAISSVPRRSASRARGTARGIMFQDLSSILGQIHSRRHKLITFRFTEAAESLLEMDELWADAIEAATGEVEVRTAHNLKLAVFKMTLLPLLDGLLSTAEEVLPFMGEGSASTEARSMLKGCLLCMDYIYADVDALDGVNSAEGAACEPACFGGPQRGLAEASGSPNRERGLLSFFNEAMDDWECHSLLEKIVTRRATLEDFLRVCRFD